jgi:hypothetical protein
MLPAEIFYWGFKILKGSLRDVFVSLSTLKRLCTPHEQLEFLATKKEICLAPMESGQLQQILECVQF